MLKTRKFKFSFQYNLFAEVWTIMNLNYIVLITALKELKQKAHLVIMLIAVFLFSSMCPNTT